MVTCVYEVVKW